MNDTSITPSTSGPQENGDWSHVKETVNMLCLAVCQIEATMNDASTSVDTLTQSFTELANHTRLTGEGTTEQESTDTLRDSMSRAVEAFQFYDRVCQRVDHVARSLEQVSVLLEDDTSMHRLDAWKALQEKIKGSYTMEAERIMFEFIMRGGSVREALEIYRHHFNQSIEEKPSDDEIELF